MNRTDQMDMLLERRIAPVGSADIVDIVRQVFNIDLQAIPALSGALDGAAALDARLEQLDGRTAGAEIRQAINEIYGVNLDALSGLDGKRISLYSKGQWILRRDEDLFVVHTGTGDADVAISAASHYRRLTGSERLPAELTEALAKLGYRCSEDGDSCSFESPAGEAVPDSFKGATIMAVLHVISRMKTET